MRIWTLTCSQDADKTDPSKSGDLAECLNAAQATSDDGSNRDKDSRACCVGRDCVKTNGNSEHARTGHKDPEEDEGCAEELAADFSKHEEASIIDTVDTAVSKFEDTDDVVGPSGDDGDGD